MRSAPRGQQLFSIMERSSPSHGTGANDDPFLNLNPPLNPAISAAGHYGEWDPYSDRDPPIYKKSVGLAMLKAVGPARAVQLAYGKSDDENGAKATHSNLLPGFVPTYQVGGDVLPGFVPTFKAAKRDAVRQGLEWDGGREWNRGSAAWVESSTPAAALDAWGWNGAPSDVPRWLRQSPKPEGGSKGDLQVLGGRWSAWDQLPSQTFIPSRLADPVEAPPQGIIAD